MLAALALGLLPACASDRAAPIREQRFARLEVPARVDAPPPAEELVSRFDESIDVRILPGARSARGAPLPPVALEGAGRHRLQPAFPAGSDVAAAASTTRAQAALVEAAERIADRQLRLVQLAPWRSGVEVYAQQGLCLLVGSLSLVDESDGDPVTIERRLSAFEGDSLAIFGLRLRY